MYALRHSSLHHTKNDKNVFEFVWFRCDRVQRLPHLIGKGFDTQYKQSFATYFGSFDVNIDHSDIASAFSQLKTYGTANTICSTSYLNDRNK